MKALGAPLGMALALLAVLDTALWAPDGASLGVPSGPAAELGPGLSSLMGPAWRVQGPHANTPTLGLPHYCGRDRQLEGRVTLRLEIIKKNIAHSNLPNV